MSQAIFVNSLNPDNLSVASVEYSLCVLTFLSIYWGFVSLSNPTPSVCGPCFLGRWALGQCPVDVLAGATGSFSKSKKEGFQQSAFQDKEISLFRLRNYLSVPSLQSFLKELCIMDIELYCFYVSTEKITLLM